MEKTIILVSNTQNSRNTLSAFSNNLSSCTLNQYSKHEMAIDSIGVHLQLKSRASPKSDDYPSILQMNQYHLLQVAKIDLENKEISRIPGEAFKFHNKFYLDSCKDYTPLLLHQELKDQVEAYAQINPAMFKGYISELENNELKFGQFLFPFQNIEKSKHKYYGTILFFHENLHNCLELGKNSMLRKIEIANQNYFYFTTLSSDNDMSMHTITASNDFSGLRIKKPEIIKILCPQLEAAMTSNGYQNILNTFTLTSEHHLGTYLHIDFPKHIFRRLNANQVSNLEVSLVDEDNKKLRLDIGGKLLALKCINYL